MVLPKKDNNMCTVYVLALLAHHIIITVPVDALCRNDGTGYISLE